MIGVMFRQNEEWGYYDNKRNFMILTPEQAGEKMVEFITTMSDPHTETTPSGKFKRVDKSVLYVTDLDLIGGALHKDILKRGFLDCTGQKGKLPNFGYNYLVSGDMGKWFGFTAKAGDAENRIYALENVIPHLSDDEILKSKVNKDACDLMTLCRVSLSIINRLISLCGCESMTISSFALHRWTELTKVFDRHTTFPDMYKVDCDLYGCSVDDYLRPSYKGGWCYVNADTTKTYKNGITLDVNSLYPYVMRCRKYPIGKPVFWVGEVPEKLQRYIDKGLMMSFYHISCKFSLKKGFLPFVQIPGDFFRQGVLYESKYHTSQGHTVDVPVELTFTEWELKLFLKHYDVCEYQVLDGCCFYLCGTVFTHYVDSYYQMKRDAKLKGDLILQSVAKFLLNGLSGNLAKKKFRQNCVLDNEGYISDIINSESKAKSYIHIASCITSYARCMMIELAQNNCKRFLYCDTDSLHLQGFEVPEGIQISETELGQFKIERKWKYAHFYKSKVYVEENTDNEFTVTYAGCPYEVQKYVENHLKSQVKMFEFFGTTRQEQGFTLDGLHYDNIPYEIESPSGTYRPFKEVIKWKIDIPEKEVKRHLKMRHIRRLNCDNILTHIQEARA